MWHACVFICLFWLCMCVFLAGTSLLDVGRLNLVFNPFPPSTIGTPSGTTDVLLVIQFSSNRSSFPMLCRSWMHFP